MPLIAEAINVHPSQVLYFTAGAIGVAGTLGTAFSKSITRVPPNSAGLWEHHGRPYADEDSIWRRLPGVFAMDAGVKKGELFEDVEPGTYGHLPGVRSIQHIGTHVRFADIAEAPIDNRNTRRQHNLGATVAWRVVPKYDEETGMMIRYTRRGRVVPYNELLRDAIYKTRSANPGEKKPSSEDALKMMVVRTCRTGLKEIMQGVDSSDDMLSDEAFPLLKVKVEEKLLDYGTMMVGLYLGDTSFTDRMPQAIMNLLGSAGDELAQASGEQGEVQIPLVIGERRLKIVRDRDPQPGA